VSSAGSGAAAGGAGTGGGTSYEDVLNSITGESSLNSS
jgi:hypothetical protein